jgi:hypothetical protein
MGIIRQGVLGGFRKKTGAVVGAYHRGQDTIRGLPRVSNKPATIKQANQRAKFGVVTNFLSFISDLIDVRMERGGSKTSGMNDAVSYHLKNAVTGVAPDFQINFTKLVFSRGKLLLPASSTVNTRSGGTVDFDWDKTDVDGPRLNGTDRVTLMAYNPTKDRFVILKDIAPRSAGTFVMNVPLSFLGDEVYCYISFASVIHSELYSPSLYVGLIPIAAIN